MRVLLWGIVALVGLGLALEAIDVHGSRDERAAIGRAVRASFADFRRRDARALCDDFTPAVDERLAARPGADCAAAVGREFQLAGNGTQGAFSNEAPSRLRITGISRHGNRATAASLDRGVPTSALHWQLQRLGNRWRIATPASLELREACAPRAHAGRVCVDVVSMHYAGG